MLSTEVAPFSKSDRVVLTYGGYSGVHGTVTHEPVYKTRPKGGKTPGWWLHVELDKEPGIKSWWVEIHADHAQPESS
ncbi:MAG: hypothetical protein JWN27_2923 [Candidatus Eremiobacteraeota bacterium]|nr:hypothetical protein [Candidatus Eremiobacteraeota bacterium]